MIKKKKESKKLEGSERVRASPDKSRAKEEVSEIFEVEKNGKEKIIETHGIEEEKPESKDQLKKERKIFLVIILAMLGFAALFAATYFISDSFNHLTIEGVKFTLDETTMTGKTLYKTSIPVTFNGSKADYNFYLRNNPKKTNEIPFNGTLLIMRNMVLNQTENFNCDGDGIIGVANVLKLYNILGVEVISDKNATCDSQERYIFLNIKEGNETRIDQTGKTCYEIQVKDCEILSATERFMIETFIKANEFIKG
jgi:ribosomal protein L23